MQKMDIVIDASALINLINADAMSTACLLDCCVLYAGPIVVKECSVDPRHRQQVEALKQRGCLKEISGGDISATEFLGFLRKYDLGEGEIECLAIAYSGGYLVCLDDKKARNAIAAETEKSRTLGSLRVLKWCVEECLHSCDDAMKMLEVMIQKGGFLPRVKQDYFCADLPAC